VRNGPLRNKVLLPAAFACTCLAFNESVAYYNLKHNLGRLVARSSSLLTQSGAAKLTSSPC
jgi:hypothetical protein